MVPLTSLLVPILLGAVIVFVVSAIFHMMLPFHKKDFKPLPGEAEVAEAIRKQNVPPGDYMMPHHSGDPGTAMKDPAFIEKMTRGPIAVMTVFPSGPPAMGGALAMWFVYCLVVSLFAGYVASRALEPGARYLDVSQIASTVAFAGFNLALWQNSIWYKRAWRTTILYTVEGVIYGLLVGGAFGWLWPKA
jgi:hypothetical protein